MSDKSPPITQPKSKCECVVLYLSLSCTCIHLYILVSTLVTPDFFSRFFVCYSAIFVLFKRGLIISSRESTRLLSAYNVCCDLLTKSRRRRKKKKEEQNREKNTAPLLLFLLILPPIISRNSLLSLSFPLPLSLGPRTYFPPFPKHKTQNPSGCA